MAGDAAAFRLIFERYAPLLMRTMLRELYVREEANDLVQQTFLQLHRARADFDAGQKLKPWIFTIALNLKREYFRRKKRRPERSLDAESMLEPVTGTWGSGKLLQSPLLCLLAITDGRVYLGSVDPGALYQAASK